MGPGTETGSPIRTLAVAIMQRAGDGGMHYTAALNEERKRRFEQYLGGKINGPW